MEGKLCTIFELQLPVLTEPIWLIYDLIIPECLPIIVGEMIVHIIVFGGVQTLPQNALINQL